MYIYLYCTQLSLKMFLTKSTVVVLCYSNGNAMVLTSLYYTEYHGATMIQKKVYLYNCPCHKLPNYQSFI